MSIKVTAKIQQDLNIDKVKNRIACVRTLKALPSWILIVSFITVVMGMILSVLVSAFATGWFGTILPEGYTLDWFKRAWERYEIWQHYAVTAKIISPATLISLLLSIPSAYILARKEFKIKEGLISFYKLPVMVPELVYALPLASLFYRIGLAETIPGLIIVLLVIGISLSLAILIPFIEALDPRLELAAQSLGADRYQVFKDIIIPQLIPGIVSTTINVFVRLFGVFVLLMLIAGPESKTITLLVFSVLSAPGDQAPAMISTLTLSLMFPLLLFTLIILSTSAYTKRRTGQ